MKPVNPRILTINGGSSSIKFALFEAADSLQRILAGGIDRIGLPEATLCIIEPTATGLRAVANIMLLWRESEHDDKYPATHRT